MADVNSLSLIVNIEDADKAGLVQEFGSRVPATAPLFVRNDTVGVNLRCVTPSATPGTAWDDVDFSTATVTIAIGEADKAPTGGAFSLTFGADTANGIAYNVSAATLQTSLNALTSITAAGGVTVTSPKTGAYVVTFNSVGARALITSANTLFPASHVVVSEVIAGDASTAEVQVVQLIVDPYALNDTWTPFPTAAATVTTIAAGSVSTQNVQSIALDPVPYAGTFQITTSILTTAAIPYNATAQQVQDALGGSSNYTVTGNAGGPWTITTTANGAVAAHTVNVSGLSVPVGLSGSLNLSTYGLFNRFLNETAESINLTMEVQVIPSGGSAGTVLQIPVTVTKDVINYSSLVPSPIPSYYTAAQVDSLLALKLSLDGSLPMTGDLDMGDGTHRIVNLADPTDPQDAVTLAAMQAAIVGSSDYTTVSNSSGNSTITVSDVSVRSLNVKATITGSARTSVFILNATGPSAGTMLSIYYDLPTTASIVIETRNNTAGGTLLDTITTDTSGDDACVRLVFNGSAWEKQSAIYPA